MLRFEKASLLHDKPRLHFLALGKKVCIVNACGTRASRAILRHTNKGDCSEDVDSPRHPAQDVAEVNFLLAALLFFLRNLTYERRRNFEAVLLALLS